MQNIPKISPIKVKEYETMQSKYNMVPNLPMRSIILGPSGSGKTILLQNMVLDIYKDCFSRIYIFSPSINVDTTWIPVKEYIEKSMNIKKPKDKDKDKHKDKDPIYFDHYNPQDLINIITTQHKVTEFMKNRIIKS